MNRNNLEYLLISLIFRRVVNVHHVFKGTVLFLIAPYFILFVLILLQPTTPFHARPIGVPGLRKVRVFNINSHSSIQVGSP